MGYYIRKKEQKHLTLLELPEAEIRTKYCYDSYVELDAK
jgi:hypothetical protein